MTTPKNGRSGGTAAANVVTWAKSHDLRDKCMYEVQAELESLDRHTLQSLENSSDQFYQDELALAGLT